MKQDPVDPVNPVNPVNPVHKSHVKSSEYFASKEFKTFNDEQAFSKIGSQRSPIVELSFKCCGYGYFPEYLTKMKENFLKYLEDALNYNTELMTLKIIFNGFDVDDGCLGRILKCVGEMISNQRLKIVWIQTTHLRKCSSDDLWGMLELIDNLVCDLNCQEIDFTMADWQFDKGYPNYRDLQKNLQKFANKISQGLKFKKFRLEMSSWYMKDGEAYNLLKDTLSNDKIMDNLLSSRQGGNNQNMRNSISRLSESDKKETTDALVYFLEHMDEAYLHPTYKVKKDDEKYNKQEERTHKEMIKKMAEYEEIISKRLIKYPKEYILQLKVEEFHKSMTAFLGGVLQRLPYIQQYHIDFRNWHSKFGMAALKKTLDTGVNSSKQERSLIHRHSGISSKALALNEQKKGGEEKVGLETIYNM